MMKKVLLPGLLLCAFFVLHNPKTAEALWVNPGGIMEALDRSLECRRLRAHIEELTRTIDALRYEIFLIVEALDGAEDILDETEINYFQEVLVEQASRVRRIEKRVSQLERLARDLGCGY